VSAKREGAILSAQVILRSAQGKAPGPADRVTSETVAGFAPDPEGAKAAREAFSRAGFEVGGLVGNSFSITAREETFRKFFGKGRPAAGRSTKSTGKGGSLPLIASVVFPEPPDFGPSDFH
jgi:hypothetical protein